MSISPLSHASWQACHHVGSNGGDAVFAVGLGMVSSYTMGGLIHLLLVWMLVVVLVRVLQGRRL